MRSSGIVEALCSILMASGIPVDILTETICAVAEAIRGNTSNQDYFASVLAPSTPPRFVIPHIICIFYENIFFNYFNVI